MTYRDLIKLIKIGVKPVVRFNEKIEHYEGYFDNNMKARIINAELHDLEYDLVKITFHCEEFEDHNDSVGKHNYYDKHGSPHLSAKEAGCYPKNQKEDYFFEAGEKIGEIFAFIDFNMDVNEKDIVEQAKKAHNLDINFEPNGMVTMKDQHLYALIRYCLHVGANNG